MVPTPVPMVQQSPPLIDRSLLREYKPKRRGEDLDRAATRKELREAKKIFALGKGKYKGKDFDTAQGVQDLRRDILEGRFGATQERKKELGLLSDVKIRPESNGTKTKEKYTKEEFEKYLETARRLDEQKNKRLAEAINDIVKETE